MARLLTEQALKLHSGMARLPTEQALPLHSGQGMSRADRAGACTALPAPLRDGAVPCRTAGATALLKGLFA